MLRWMVHNFLQQNKYNELHDLNINKCIILEATTFEEYLQDIVLKDHTEARTLIIVIAPIVLRINLEVVLFDLRIEENTEILPYESVANGIKVELEDSLNMHDKCISVILKYGHYDLLYQNNYIERHSILKEYDEIPINLYDNPSTFEECSVCNSKVTTLDNIYVLLCGHSYHTICLSTYIEASTENKVILTNKEREKIKQPKCKKCSIFIGMEEYNKIFGDSAINYYTNLRNYRETREIEISIIKDVAVVEVEEIECDSFCDLCNKKMYKGYVLNCSHEFHTSCLKKNIELQSDGKIFLTIDEKASQPITCFICKVEIDDETIERLFKEFPTAMQSYKRHRYKRESSEHMPLSHELTCCKKLKTIEELKQKLQGTLLFSIKDNKLELCSCPFCKSNLGIKDAIALFNKDDIEAILSLVCANCLKPLKEKKSKADCEVHFTCDNCTDCSVCIKPKGKKNSKRCVSEDNGYGVQCESCQKFIGPLSGTLLDCYHFKCNKCKPKKGAKKLYCSICKEDKGMISVILLIQR